MANTDESITTAAELLRLEDERSRAVLAGDVAVLERLMSDDIVYTHSNGRLDTKRSFIASVSSGAVKYRRIHRRDAAVSVRTGFAFITGGIEIDVETGGQLRHLVLRYSNVWERTPKAWQQVLWQTTPLPPPQ